MRYSVVKKFSGTNLLKIFEKIKEDAGGNSILLGYEEKDIGGKKHYEIIVGIPDKNLVTSDNGQLNKDVLEKVLVNINDMRNEFRMIKDSLEFISRKVLSSAELKLKDSALSFFKKLVSRGVEKNTALSIVQEIYSRCGDDQARFEKAFIDILSDYLLFDVPKTKGKILALVGPTGVGKTTTAAKIGAVYIASGIRNIAFLGTDRYRIASVEQIKKYADIMGVPLFVATTPEEIKRIIYKLDQFDIVIVDTMGKSHYDIKSIRKIASLIKEIGLYKKIEVFLLISCSQREEEMISVIRNFSEIGIDYLIFTKIDETFYSGSIINIGSMIEKPIAFFTTGQSVPDDIKIASPKNLADIILGPPPLTKYLLKEH